MESAVRVKLFGGNGLLRTLVVHDLQAPLRAAVAQVICVHSRDRAASDETSSESRMADRGRARARA